jgi:ribonuclease J
VRDNEELLKRAQEVVQDVLRKKAPVAVLENKIKDALATFTSKELGRRPMILPLVMDV